MTTNLRPILKNKYYLYLTEFFAGVSVMAVELGASRLLAPYFSSSQIVWTIIIGTIMIAMALACEPDILIADEPTTALDVTIQAQILELMQELQKKLGMAIIMITHDLGIVARMCEKIAVMYAGKIVEYGTTDEIFYEPKHEYTKGLLRSIPRLDSRDHERLVPIEGTPVDMLNPPKGCPFAPRCGACMKVCLREMPPRTDFSDTHYTQCWLCQKAEFEAAQGGNVQ